MATQPQGTKVFYDDDADLARLDGRTIAIVGYGNQGRSQALNMRDSGVENVVVGSVRDESWERAEVMERVAETGIFDQLKLHSRTSQYGQTTRFEELDRTLIKAFLKEALEERIRSGRFDREWTEAQNSESPVLEGILERVGRHPIVETEGKLREALGGGIGGADGKE